MTLLIISEKRTVWFARYLCAAALGALGLFLLLVVGKTFAGVYFYEHALAGVGRQEYDRASELLDRAIQLSPQDRYYRSKAQVRQLQIRDMLTASDGTLDEVQFEAFNTWANEAIDLATEATIRGADDADNWLVLGNAYAQLVMLNIEGTRGLARSAYERAHELAPYDPASLTLMARATDDPEEARAFVAEALALDARYAPALSLRAELNARQ